MSSRSLFLFVAVLGLSGLHTRSRPTTAPASRPRSCSRPTATPAMRRPAGSPKAGTRARSQASCASTTRPSRRRPRRWRLFSRARRPGHRRRRAIPAMRAGRNSRAMPPGRRVPPQGAVEGADGGILSPEPGSTETRRGRQLAPTREAAKRPLELGAFDCRPDGGPQHRREPLLEAGPRDRDRGGHLGHLDPLARVLLNERHGLGHFCVRDREHVGGAASHDSHRIDREVRLPRRGPLGKDELVQQHCRPVAQPSRPLFDAAQGGRAQETQELVVVDADDRDLLRHSEVVGTARFEDVPAEVVVRGHDADRLWQPP